MYSWQNSLMGWDLGVMTMAGCKFNDGSCSDKLLIGVTFVTRRPYLNSHLPHMHKATLYLIIKAPTNAQNGRLPPSKPCMTEHTQLGPEDRPQTDEAPLLPEDHTVLLNIGMESEKRRWSWRHGRARYHEAIALNRAFLCCDPLL